MKTLTGLKDVLINQFRGISRLNKYAISESFATVLENLSCSDFPSLVTRDGYTLIGTAFPARIMGLGAWKKSEIHVMSNGSWSKWNGTSWVSLVSSGLNATADWSFCNFKGNFTGINLIASNGTDPIKKYDGTTVSNLTNAPTGGNFIDQHDNRLYCAVGNSVKFSALNKPEDWTTVDDAGEIVVETNDGETINGLKSGAGHVIVFFPSSIHEIYGTSPADYRKIDVADDIGFISNKCITNLDGTIYWMSKVSAYIYSGGSRPDKSFCQPIQDYINRINKLHYDKCSVGNNGKNLLISIPLDTATEPDTVLEYDPLNQTWYVWKNLQLLKFITVNNEIYSGTVDGKIIKLGGLTDNGTAISWKWVSKPLTSQSMSQKIRLLKLWINAELSGGTMTAYINKSDSGDTDWVQVTLDANNRAIIPLNVATNASCIRVKIQGTGKVSLREIIMRLREIPYK